MYPLQATMEFPVVKLADRLTYIILNCSSMVETYAHSHPYKTRTTVAKVVCYIDIKRMFRLRLCCTEWGKSNDHRNHCFNINSFHLFFLPILSFCITFCTETYLFVHLFLYSVQSFSLGFFYSLVTSLTFQFLPLKFFLSSVVLFQISFNETVSC